MNCAVCNAEFPMGARSCPRCGAVTSGRSKPIPVWVEEGLGRLPATSSDDPPVFALYLFSLLITGLLWQWSVVPFLELTTSSVTDMWLVDILGLTQEEVSLAFKATQEVVLGHVINLFTISVALWALTFSLLRIVITLRWMSIMSVARTHLRRHIVVSENLDPPQRLSAWVMDPSRPKVADGVLRDLYELLAYRNPDPEIAFSERSEKVASASQRTSIMPRVAVWAVPILGFLGTVLGISQAIGSFGELTGSSNVVPGTASIMNHFQSTMGEVMNGLATAFNTTLIALALVVPVAILVEVSGVIEESIRSRLRFQLFREVWINIAPSWRTSIGHGDSVTEAARSDAISGEVHHLGRQLEALGVRISSLHGFVAEFGQQVERLHTLIRLLEPVDDDSHREQPGGQDDAKTSATNRFD